MKFEPLTSEQYQGALDAGFTHDKIIQNEIIRKKEATPVREWWGEILPVGGAILGGIGGTIVGGFAGGAAGAGVGAAAGEAAQQQIEKAQGTRQAVSGKDIVQQGVTQAATEIIGAPIISGVGKVIKAVGKGVAKYAIPTSIKEAGLLQAYKASTPVFGRILAAISGNESKAPITAAETSFQKGLVGGQSMIGVQAKKEGANLWNTVISPALKASKAEVDMPAFFKEARDIIIKTNPEKARQGDLLSALKSLQESYKGVTKVSLEDLQKFKEGWAEFVPEKAYQGKPIAGAFNDVKDVVSDMARSKIYKELGPEVKQAYFDYGNLKGLQELGKKAMTGGKFVGGFGGFWSAIKDMAVTPVATLGGQGIYKVGQGVELLGKPGARFIRDLLPATIDIGKETQ